MKRLGYLVGIFCSLVIVGLITQSCGRKNEEVVFVEKEPEPPKSCDGIALGEVKDKVCPAGEQGAILLVCTETGWDEKRNTCEPIDNGTCDDSGPNFVEDIKPIITKHCMNCHAVNQLDTYAVAKAWSKESLARFDLNPANLKFMPKDADPLSAEERSTWLKWDANGHKEKAGCNDANGEPYQLLDFGYVEDHILNDLEKLDRDDQENSVYAVLSHKYNLKSSPEDMDQFVDGLNKMINSVSTEDKLVRVTAIDERETIFRIDQESYDLSNDDWEAILGDEFFNFESNTIKGELIKSLTGKRISWLHADNLVLAGLGGNINGQASNVYYQILDLPIGDRRIDPQLSDLENIRRFTLGVNFQDEIDDFDVPHLGFFGSSISINKNRLLTRAETDDGRLWSTYDTNSNDRPEQNLFEFPLLAESGGQNIYDFQASEHIFTLPNGLDGYLLTNAAGVAEVFAPLDTVFDNQTPSFDPTIRNAFSCNRCHANGILPATDQVANKILNSGTSLTRDDIELVSEHYRNNGPQLFVADNRDLRKALDSLGVEVSQPDPINYLTDRLRKDMTLNEVAAFVFMSPEEFVDELRKSNVVSDQIGQLATGGTISFQQLVNVFPDLIDEFRLGQDDLRDVRD